MISQHRFEFRPLPAQLLREIEQHRNRGHLRLEEVGGVADAWNFGVIRDVDRRPDSRIFPERIDQLFEQGVRVENAFVVGVPVELRGKSLRVTLVIRPVTAHEVQHDERAFPLEQRRQVFEQSPVRPGAPEQKILHRIEPDPPFRAGGECRDRGVEPAARILVAQEDRFIGAVIRRVEETRVRRILFTLPVLIAGRQQHCKYLHGLGVTGIRIAQEDAVRRLRGATQKRCGVPLVSVGARPETAV